jgi:peptidyl-prolyl cis-trans isomerase B (cyclophilin B)
MREDQGVPTNQQRRDAAKRKLERQLARREAAERARRQRMVIIGVVAAVVIVAGGVWLWTSRDSSTAASNDSSSTAETSSTAPATPCTYTASGSAAKEVSPPSNTSPLNTGTVDVTVVLNGKDVPITLNRATAPCGVNSFLSLASQGFYNDTNCHRLTRSDQLNVLQCGDPTGQGNGGPGYTFASETTGTETYPVGTVALANAGPDTTGSQFFIVYGTTTIDPSYTIIGTVTGDGMAVVQDVASQGVQNNRQDGAPVAAATITSVTVPDGSLDGTGTYETATPSDGLGTGSVDTGSVDTGSVDTGSVDTGSVDTGATDAPAPTAATTSGGAG